MTSAAAFTRDRGWLGQLKAGLHRSSTLLADGIGAILARRKLDSATLEELEELLISADLGVTTAAKLTQALAKAPLERDATPEAVRASLADEIARTLEPVARPLELDPAARPNTVLVMGVNGTGKTTTIGKLAKRFRDDGKAVMLAACDTFRAAAIDQLKIWGERTGCPVVAREPGADAAGLAFDALSEARAQGADVLLIDTAGRLQNKTALMAELQKIVRVLKKIDAAAPHSRLLVLDATTGQNAHSQVEVFSDFTDLTGLVLTKLDGTARGGVVVALAERFRLPVHAVGIGERVDDLKPFEARAFARALLGLEN
ncbi:MAG: signal recognition particle-docking protein FtsY [Alphaproteobacteria bacterium]